MRWIFWTGAALAVALDAGRAEAAMLLSQCVSGSLAESALRAIDIRHFSAFPLSTAFMLGLCLPAGARAGASPVDACLRGMAWRVPAMLAAMPLACIVGAIAANVAVQVSAQVAVPGAMLASGPAWAVLQPLTVGALAYGAAMFAACAGVLHLLEHIPAARRLSASPSRRSSRSFSC